MLMPVVRLVIMLVLIALFVLVTAYLLTRNKQYLIYARQLLTYVAWIAIAIGLLFLISRVILL